MASIRKGCNSCAEQPGRRQFELVAPQLWEDDSAEKWLFALDKGIPQAAMHQLRCSEYEARGLLCDFGRRVDYFKGKGLNFATKQVPIPVKIPGNCLGAQKACD